MLEVSGDARGRRALEIAAAGGHSLLLVGPPGAAKMKLARRLPSILPDLDDATTRELTRIYSVAGMNLGGALVRRVPFRAPHHTTSSAGLVGGGPSVIRPGEMSLAHGGVLFLDELSEFQGTTLLMLREPMAAGEVQIARGTGVVKLPARAHVVAAMNGCPCGQRGSFESRCRCTAVDVARHQQRGSALASVIEMRVELTARAPGEPASEPAPESSATIKARVVAARSLMARTKGYDEDDNTRRVIVRALERTGLTTTGLEKARGIACTIAALGASVVDGQIVVRAQHMIEALEFTASASIATNSPAATA
ncbi:MAG TPA: ATP-binding protein [Myxococcota bacterium]